ELGQYLAQTDVYVRKFGASRTAAPHQLEKVSITHDDGAVYEKTGTEIESADHSDVATRQLRFRPRVSLSEVALSTPIHHDGIGLAKRIELGGDVGQEKDRLVRVEGKDLQPGQALVLRILPDGGLLFRIERPYTCHAAYGTRWKELPPRKRRTPIELILHRTHQHDIAIELADSEQHAVYERVVKSAL